MATVSRLATAWSLTGSTRPIRVESPADVERQVRLRLDGQPQVDVRGLPFTAGWHPALTRSISAGPVLSFTVAELAAWRNGANRAEFDHRLHG